jgi:hypothetical protein
VITQIPVLAYPFPVDCAVFEPRSRGCKRFVTFLVAGHLSSV